MSATTIPADLEQARRSFQALADETRVRIYLLLVKGEQCVCTIHDTLDLPQSTVSRHLAVLRTAGLVAARRDGRWIHYRIATSSDPVLAQICRALSGSWRPPKGRKEPRCGQ